METACYSCDFFNILTTMKDGFSYQIFREVAPQATSIIKHALELWLILMGMSWFFFPSKAGQMTMSTLFKLPWIAMALASIHQVDGVPWVFSKVISPIEAMGLNYGIAILNTLGSARPVLPEGAPDTAAYGYTQLAALVEQQMFSVIQFCYELATLKPQFDIDTLIRFIASIILALPFLFVVGIFTAFLLEAMFKVVAVGIVSPLLVMCAIFGPTRPFAIAGARILLGAALTIIFASGAMGFTITGVNHYSVPFMEKVASMKGENLKDPTLLNDVDKKKIEDAAICERMNSFFGFGRSIAPGRYQELNCSELYVPNQANEIIFSKNYIILFVIGFSSILLHLASKSLASNLSGANDGAGPAAAVVAGAQMALGAGTYAATRLAFGQGGAGTTAQQMLRGEAFTGAGGSPLSAGQMLHQHGALGAPAALVMAMRNGFSNGSQGAADMALQNQMSPGAQRFSSGGQDTSQSFQELNKNLTQLVDILKKGQASPAGRGVDRFGNTST
ncbi:MAG: hypothetical protein EPN26_03450 [Rhodospirillales bacterium]|nr:MAG: hypothetical protein EPN26_03450 [Rhodospirillales bacterium]